MGYTTWLMSQRKRTKQYIVANVYNRIWSIILSWLDFINLLRMMKLISLLQRKTWWCMQILWDSSYFLGVVSLYCTMILWGSIIYMGVVSCMYCILSDGFLAASKIPRFFVKLADGSIDANVQCSWNVSSIFGRSCFDAQF